MKTNMKIGIVALALIAVLIYNPDILQYGPPTAIAIKVIDNNQAGVSNAVCYVNPSGTSKCSDPNSYACQFTVTSGSDGMCTFNNDWNGSMSYTIGVACPKQFADNENTTKTITQVVDPRSGITSVSVLCGTGKGGNGTGNRSSGTDACPSVGDLRANLFSQEVISIGVVKASGGVNHTYIQQTVSEYHCVIDSITQAQCLAHGLRWGGDTISADGKSVIRGGGAPQRCFGALVQVSGGGYDPAMTAADKLGPLCLMEIYPDEFCSDFNYGTKSYSLYDVLPNGRKRCATAPGYDWGTCASPAAPAGDLCVQNPKYTTPNVCKQAYGADGGFCCIAPINPEPEYGDCSKFPGSVKEMRDGIPTCVKPLDLVQGECTTGTKQVVDGKTVCVVNPDVSNGGGGGTTTIIKTITNTVTQNNWVAIILAFAGGGLVMYFLGGGKIKGVGI